MNSLEFLSMGSHTHRIPFIMVQAVNKHGESRYVSTLSSNVKIL